MEQQIPVVPVATQQAQVAVEPEVSLADLGKQASQGNEMPRGKFRVRVNMAEWKNSRSEIEEATTHLPKSGNSQLSYTVIEVIEGDQSALGKKDKFINHFKSGVTNGFPWSGERDAIGFLMKHGITPAMIQTTETLDAMGIRKAKDTFSPWFQYVGDFGGEYIIERKANTNNAEKTSEFIREYPICFDAEGNPLPKPMPTVPGASIPAPQQVEAPVVQPTVVAEVPVAMPQAVPVAEVPVPVQAPVAQAPVQAPVVPVAEIPVPQAQVPTGLPTGLPGM